MAMYSLSGVDDALGVSPMSGLLFQTLPERIARLRALAAADETIHVSLRARYATRAVELETMQRTGLVPLAITAPAFDRWRREVLATWERRSPLELAAACEAFALECDTYDDPIGASVWRVQAAQYVARAA